MKVDFPQIDYIVHAVTDQMSYVQKEYVNLLNKNNNFINLTLENLLDRISRTYEPVSIIKLLAMVRKTMDEEKTLCADSIVYDDFVKNASIVSQSLKKIIMSPSRNLVRVEKMVPANKVTRFDSKTMSWLAKRPGASIEEKIAPKNTIPTKVTCFTPDTVENRHTMYLYDILYDYLYEKVYPSDRELKCESCPYVDKKCHILFEKLETILFLKHHINTTDLKTVKKEKQTKQNNKLLSDKEYKQIWDAVREIDYFEENCKNMWDNLLARYYFLIFMEVAANISKYADIKVFNDIVEVKDSDGKIFLSNRNNEKNSIIFFSNNDNVKISLKLKEDKLIYQEIKAQKVNDAFYEYKTNKNEEFNLSSLFDDLDEIDCLEKEYHNAEVNIESILENRKNLKFKLDDFESKIPMLSDVMRCLLKLTEEVEVNEQKEKEKVIEQ